MRRELEIQLIREELDRAEKKHPTWPDDPIHAAAIMCEEAGETIQAALDAHYAGKDAGNIKTEAIQTGAMAIRLLINL